MMPWDKALCGGVKTPCSAWTVRRKEAPGLCRFRGLRISFRFRLLRLFYKPDVEVRLCFRDPVDPSQIGVLPEGEVIGGVGRAVVVGIPDDRVFESGHIQDVGLGGAVCIDGRGIAGLADRLTEGDGIVGKLFPADVVEAGIVIDLDLRVKGDRKGDLDAALLNDIQTELGLLAGLLFRDGLGKDVDADLEAGFFGTPEIFDGAAVLLQVARMEGTVAGPDKDKLDPRLPDLFPVDLSLKFRYIDPPADRIDLVALVVEDAIFIEREVLPVVIVQRRIEGEGPSVKVLPGLDIFFLKLCEPAPGLF